MAAALAGRLDWALAMLAALLVAASALALLSARRARLLDTRIAHHLEISLAGALARGVRPGGNGKAQLQAPAIPAGTPVAVASPVVADYVKTYQAKDFLREIDRTILRTGSIDGRDVLAVMATGGTMGWEQVRGTLRLYRDPKGRKRALSLIAAWEPKTARRLARVVALQTLLPDDRMNALTLYKALVEAQGVRALDLQHGKLAADLSFYLRQWDFLDKCLAQFPLKEVDRQFLEADRCNPFIDSPHADHDRWLELINRGFVKAGIAPIQVRRDEQGSEPPFDRLHTVPLAAVGDGDLVTVVITSWCPDEGLMTAVQSICRQTWTNLEILLIDDASPAAFDDLLSRVVQSDPRIRLIKQEKNGGTYVARSRGVHEGRGRYFTVHDSDDWAHPQRIEIQIRELQADPTLVSVSSFAYRCDDNLVVNFPGVLPDRENASSLLFELDKVRSEIGYYDAARKGADTEYMLRIKMAFGDDAHRVVLKPLAMIRLTPGSLSRAEFKPGWRHPARAYYRRSYETWHRKILLEQGSGYVPLVQDARPFRLPRRFVIDQSGEEILRRSHYDVVFVADCRASAAPDAAMAHEAAAAAAAGLKVGLLHMESYRNLSLREIEPFEVGIEELLQRGVIEEVLYTDETTIGTLIVRDASILQFSLPYKSSFLVSTVFIVASHAGRGLSGRLEFDALECSTACFRMFGAEPIWMATGDEVARQIEATLSTRMVSPVRWPQSVVYDLSAAPPGQRGGKGPVVGRVISGSKSSLPRGKRRRSLAFLSGTDIQMRFLVDANGSLGELLEAERAPNWNMLGSGEIARFTFYAQCDFYANHNDATDDHQYRHIVEAMAAGCVPVLSPDWKAMFGDAALYCEPEQAAGVILACFADVHDYVTRQQAAVEWASEGHGPALLGAVWEMVQPAA